MTLKARPGTIRGRVLSHAGIPMEGARIMLEASSPDHPDLAQMTAADGRFVLRGLPAGRHVVKAVADAAHGTVSAAVAVDLEAGDDAAVELVLA